MKKKIVIFVLILTLLIVALTSVVKAANTNEVMYINNAYALTQYQTLNENSFSFEQDIERSSEIINGNLFLYGNMVSIKDETINGDVFVFANMLTIDNTTNINGNLYLCASSAKISAKIERCVYACAQDLVFEDDATVGYESYVISEHFLIDGTFNRNIYAFSNILEINEHANIVQTLNFTSTQEAKINEKAKINEIKFDKYEEKKESLLSIISKYALDFVRYFVLTMILFIIFIKFTPKFLKQIDKCFGVSSFGIGILSLLIIPISIILLITIKVASSLAFAMLALFIFLLLISNAVTVVSIASLISRKVKKIKLPMLVALTAAISWAIFQIPFVGAILSFFMFTSGIGVILKYLVIRKNN